MNKKISVLLMLVMLIGMYCISFINNIVVAIEIKYSGTVQFGGTSGTDGNYLLYKDTEGKLIGKVAVRLDTHGEGEQYFTPTGNQVSLLGKNESYRIMVDIIPEPGYSEVSALENGVSVSLPGAEPNGIRSYGIAIDSLNKYIILDITFGKDGGAMPGGGHHENYPIIAYFNGVNTPIISDQDGYIQIPSGWTTGNVEFYASVCEIDGKLRPYIDGEAYDPGTQREMHIDIEGVANLNQINSSVDVNGDSGDEYIVVKKGFSNYGKVVLHLITEPINTRITLISENYVGVRATAEYDMSYSLGSVAIDNAILTNNNAGEVSIFFGNISTTLVAEGPNVDRITKVTGGEEVIYNEDGTSTVKLPPLSEETTTQLTLTIKMKDNSIIIRKLKVARTAIDLIFTTADGDATLLAGYVVNKAYLYDNKDHDPKIFDAYLQVILYKDGVVAGYKQVQIDDEDFVNSLGPNDSGSIEVCGPGAIVLYGKASNDTIEGVNSASVFLTNGPLNFDNKTLPSVEFGIGSGVTINFGGDE